MHDNNREHENLLEDIDNQQSQLELHRRTLQIYLKQRAKLGEQYMPPGVSHGIDEARQEIRRIKGALRNLDIKVEDRSCDEELLHQEMPSARSVFTRSGLLTRLPTLAILTLLIAGLIWLITIVIHNGVATAKDFQYQVRILSKTTQQAIPNAKVTIEVGGVAPIDEITDSNGFTRVTIDNSRSGKPGRLIVEMPQYRKFVQNIDLQPDTLPNVIQLDPIP